MKNRNESVTSEDFGAKRRIIIDLKPTEWEGVKSINIDWGSQASLNRILTLRAA